MATNPIRTPAAPAAGLKPVAAAQKDQAPAVVPDVAVKKVVNDITVVDNPFVDPIVATAAEVTEVAEASETQAEPSQWPLTISVRNDSPSSVVCPICGLYSTPGSQREVLLFDPEHAQSVISNIRQSAALLNVSAQIVITGLPDGL